MEHIGARLVLPLLGPLELELVASEVNNEEESAPLLSNLLVEFAIKLSRTI